MEVLRTSSYIIPIKLESEKEKYMLIHGYTGAMDIVSNDLLEKINSIEMTNCFSETTFQTLLKRGYITYKTKAEETEYVAKIAKALHKKAKILNNSFTLIITYNCNFRCPYCFEGRNMKDNNSYLSFSKEMVDGVFNAIEEIEPREELRNKIITLYGGEPLLVQNKDIIDYIVNKGHKKGYKFSVITNGYDLKYYIDLLSPELICKVQITIDGTKDYHNQRRIHYNDTETFDKIVSNVKLALETGTEVVIRVNNDNKNVEDFVRLKKYFEENGFFSHASFKMYSTLLWNSTSISEEEQQSLDFLSSQSYISKHEEMKTIENCKDYGMSYKIHQALSKNKPIPFRSVFCASQAGGYAFDPLGNIYPCWEIVGDNTYRIGTYKNNKIEWDNEKLNAWRNYNITTDSTCKTCKYALFCGGGCVTHAKSGNRDHCAYFRTMFNSVINRSFEGTIK